MEEGRIPLSPHDSSPKRFRLDGKTAIITGAASGIGRAIARTFADGGACVHILDLDRARAEEVAAEIESAGGEAKAHECDVSSGTSVRDAFGPILNAGRVEILVNNAGIAFIGDLEKTEPADFEKISRVNVKSVFLCMQACIEHMKRAGGGAILNMASIAASAGIADRFAYSMSKGAVRAMTYSVAKDYLDDKIRCNCISPARVKTPFVEDFVQKNYPGRENQMLGALARSQPVGRMAEPQEIAALALFLCSDEASFITGVDYPIDGGFFTLRG